MTGRRCRFVREDTPRALQDGLPGGRRISSWRELGVPSVGWGGVAEAQAAGGCGSPENQEFPGKQPGARCRPMGLLWRTAVGGLDEGGLDGTAECRLGRLRWGRESIERELRRKPGDLLRRHDRSVGPPVPFYVPMDLCTRPANFVGNRPNGQSLVMEL